MDPNELLQKAQNADAAGDTESARELMKMYREASVAPVETPPVAEPTFESWRASKPQLFPQMARAMAKGGARGLARGALGLANVVQNLTGGDIQTGKPVPVEDIYAGIDKAIPPAAANASVSERYPEAIGQFIGEILPNAVGTAGIMRGINPRIVTKALGMAGLVPTATKALSTLEAPVSSFPRLARYLSNAVSGGVAGGVSGAILPTEKDASWLGNTISGSVLGAAVPMATGVLGGSADFFKTLVTPTGLRERVAQHTIDQIGPVAAENTANLAGAYIAPHPLTQTKRWIPSFTDPVGSRKTTAAVTGDLGLAVNEAVTRAADPARYAAHDIYNDVTRRNYLNVITPGESEIAAAKQARDAVTNPMREALTTYDTSPAAALKPFFDRANTSAMTPGTQSQRMLMEGTNALAPAEGGMTAALIKTNRQMADAIGSNGATDGLFSSVRGDPSFGNQLLSEMNDTLDASTHGKWAEYLSRHKDLSQLPNELEAQVVVKEKVDKALLSGRRMKASMIVRALAKEAENPYGSALTDSVSKPFYSNLLEDLNQQEAYKRIESTGNLTNMYNDLRVAQGAEGPLLSGGNKMLALLRGGQNLARSGGTRAATEMSLDPNLYSLHMLAALKGRRPPTLDELQKRAFLTSLGNTTLNRGYRDAVK